MAYKEVQSVIVKPSNAYTNDSESDTSNALAKTLGVKGEVYIGDKALKLYLKEPQGYIDLAKEWNKKTSLPFVFARFCFNKRGSFYKKLSKEFNRKKIKIPRYILAVESKKRGLSQKEAIEYLKLISYKVGAKEKKGFKLFMQKVRDEKSVFA